MRDSRPQRCVQELKTSKPPQNATNENKHINTPFKKNSADDQLKITSKYTQGTFSNRKICFNVLNKKNYDKDFKILSQINETVH